MHPLVLVLHLGFSTVIYPKGLCVREKEEGRNIGVKLSLFLLRSDSGSGDSRVVPCFEECVKALRILTRSDRVPAGCPMFRSPHLLMV